MIRNRVKMGNSTSAHTHEPLERGFTRDRFGDIKNTVCLFIILFINYWFLFKFSLTICVYQLQLTIGVYFLLCQHFLLNLVLIYGLVIYFLFLM